MSNNFPLIVVDESTDARITAVLQREGYKVFSVQQLMPVIDDLAIIVEAEKLNAYILTKDKDFGDELVFRKASSSGAMLLRLGGVDIDKKIRLVLTTIKNQSEELLNAFSVLNKRKLRIRKMS
jgi:predicted nuclease of predicted toxin-antitoxin system